MKVTEQFEIVRNFKDFIRLRSDAHNFILALVPSNGGHLTLRYSKDQCRNDLSANGIEYIGKSSILVNICGITSATAEYYKMHTELLQGVESDVIALNDTFYDEDITILIDITAFEKVELDYVNMRAELTFDTDNMKGVIEANNKYMLERIDK